MFIERKRTNVYYRRQKSNRTEQKKKQPALALDTLTVHGDKQNKEKT